MNPARLILFAGTKESAANLLILVSRSLCDARTPLKETNPDARPGLLHLLVKIRSQ